MAHLNPCPFCGHRAEYYKSFERIAPEGLGSPGCMAIHSVSCVAIPRGEGCGATVWGADEADAARRWNARSLHC